MNARRAITALILGAALGAAPAVAAVAAVGWMPCCLVKPHGGEHTTMMEPEPKSVPVASPCHGEPKTGMRCCLSEADSQTLPVATSTGATAGKDLLPAELAVAPAILAAISATADGPRSRPRTRDPDRLRLLSRLLL